MGRQTDRQRGVGICYTHRAVSIFWGVSVNLGPPTDNLIETLELLVAQPKYQVLKDHRPLGVPHRTSVQQVSMF